jgi:GTP cyclohydrolase I
MEEVLDLLGLDRQDDSLIETPRRIAKMWVNESCAGLDYDNFPKCTTVENKMSAEDEFVSIGNIRVTSICEHHFVPFVGVNETYGGAVVAYIPKDNVLGLSKAARVVEFFARRPQVQERLTNQVAEALKVICETEDVAVFMNCTHLCMTTRGALDPGASTVTCAMGGRFQSDDNIRKEFLALARAAFDGK